VLDAGKRLGDCIQSRDLAVTILECDPKRLRIGEEDCFVFVELKVGNESRIGYVTAERFFNGLDIGPRTGLGCKRLVRSDLRKTRRVVSRERSSAEDVFLPKLTHTVILEPILERFTL
jgi:hypothetical protein